MAVMGERGNLEDNEARTYDVVVCGAGVSGLCAACKAAEKGLSVVCIEKCSCSSSGDFNYGFVNTKTLTSLGARTYDEEEYISSLILHNGGIGNPALYRNFVRANPEVGDWAVGIAEELGHECHLSPDSSSFRLQDQYGMYTAYAREHGAEVLYDTPARRLVMVTAMPHGPRA